MSEIYSPVLVLNSGWNPIHIKATKDAIGDVFNSVAEIVEHTKFNDNILSDDADMFMSFGTYHTWESWVETSKLTIPRLQKLASDFRAAGDEVSALKYEPRLIQLSKGLIVRGPEVIRLPHYAERPDIDIRLSRKNLLLRDNFQCQYCACHVTMADSTLDHVIPRSRGGKGSWDNYVISCFKCNVKKKDRTPEEANMPLLFGKPKKPNWYPLTTRFTANTPPSWEGFLPATAMINRPKTFDQKSMLKNKKR